MVNRSFAGLCTSLVVASAMIPLAVHAATVNVTTTTPNNPNDGACGLIEAINAVNQGATFANCTYTPNGQNDRINVNAGTHTLNTDLAIERQVEIVGAGQTTTIINSGAAAIIRYDGQDLPNPILRIRNLTIQKVSTQTLPVIGVLITSDQGFPSNLVMDNVRVRNCSDRGLFLTGDGVDATITNSLIESNGVGIQTEDILLTITNSTIRNNKTGIDLSTARTGLRASITSTTISNNIGNLSGAGLNVAFTGNGAPSTALVDIVGSTFSGNQATGNGGGIQTNATIEIRESVFDNNRATAGGGGLYIAQPPNSTPIVIVRETTFKNNRANQGAGIYLAGSGATAEMEIYESTVGPGNVATAEGGGIFTSGQINEMQNVTLTGNQATRGGGLFHVDGGGGENHLRHVTVIGNVATQSGGGAGLRLAGANQIVSFSIFANNTIGTGATRSNLVSTDPALRAFLCLIDDRAGTGTTPNAIFPIASEGGNNLVGPAGVGALTNPAAPATAVFPLQTGSLAIDAIPVNGDILSIDQLGRTRPVDGDFDGLLEGDIGSVEARQSSASLFQAESMTVAAQSAQALIIESNANYSNGQGRVLQAATLSNPAPFVTFQSANIPVGTYGVTVRYKRAANAGRFTFAVGTNAGSTSTLGPTVDAFNGTADWKAAYLGTITVSAAGTRFFKFTAPSKNNSSTGFFMYMDSVRLFTNTP